VDPVLKARTLEVVVISVVVATGSDFGRVKKFHCFIKRLHEVQLKGEQYDEQLPIQLS